MSWLRAGDNAATHPIVMRVAALARGDDRAVNEVFGFVTRCALQSAGHLTDYVVDEGTAWMLGGSRTEQLLALATKAGYLTKRRHKGHTVYRLVQDPEFLHIRLRSEIEWERQARADAANPALTVPVRLRDGDSCRYCGRVANFRPGVRKGALAGTYDHREPGNAATLDTFVVSCKGCNAGRRDDPDADARYPLRPVPARPFYSAHTAAWLREHGHTVEATEDLRPGTQPGTAPRDPAAGGTPRTTRPRSRRDTAKKSGHGQVTTEPYPAASDPAASGTPPMTSDNTQPGSADIADPVTTESRYTGSGRVGKASTGRPRDGPARGGAGKGGGGRRGRRGGGSAGTGSGGS